MISSTSHTTGIEEHLKMLIISCASRSLRAEPIKSDSVDFINQARVKWTEILLRHYDYIEQKMRVGKSSSSSSSHSNAANIEDGSGGSSSNIPSNSEGVFIFDEKNFFNFMISLKNTSAVSAPSTAPNTLMKVCFRTPSLSELRVKFSHLLSNDNIENKSGGVSAEQKIRERKSRTLAENEAMESEIESLAQGGIPSGDRVELYTKYFSIDSGSFKVNNLPAHDEEV